MSPPGSAVVMTSANATATVRGHVLLRNCLVAPSDGVFMVRLSDLFALHCLQLWRWNGVLKKIAAFRVFVSVLNMLSLFCDSKYKKKMKSLLRLKIAAILCFHRGDNRIILI